MNGHQSMKIAHRGFNQPDNSITAFHSAIEAGFDMIEMDIQLCRNNTIIIFHDCHIIGIPTSHYTHEQIKLQHPTVITLDDFFKEFPDYTNMKIHIDMKGSDELAVHLKNYFVNNDINGKNIYIGSFNINHIRILAGINAKLGIITCNAFTIAQYCDIYRNLHFISVDKSILNQNIVNICNGLKKKLFVFTCDNYQDLHYINLFNVDGIISNIIL